jgi:hypothetical protein
MIIDMAEQVEQKQTWGIVARRSLVGVTVSNQGADKGKFDQRGNQPAHAALNVAVWKYFCSQYALFCGPDGNSGEW